MQVMLSKKKKMQVINAQQYWHPMTKYKDLVDRGV